MPRKTAPKNPTTKIFVLDTNVLMHDPTSLYRFEEHDLFIPIMTLEELDDHKKGMSEIARNARQVSRMLDELLAFADDIDDGIQGAHLVKMDLFRGAAVHLAFGLPEPPEDPLGRSLYLWG